MEGGNLQSDSKNEMEDISALDLDSLDPESRQKVEEDLKLELSKVRSRDLI